MKSIVPILFCFIFTFHNINAQVGIGTTDPNAQLDIRSSDQAAPSNNDGVLVPKVDNFPTVNPTVAQDGMLVYATGGGTPTKGFYYWDQATTSWVGLSNGRNTLDEAYDQGGAGNGKEIVATDGAVTISGEDGFYVKGNYNTGEVIAIDPTYNSLMFFNPRKSAFRVGRSFGSNWDDVNVGDYSVAFGHRSLASGLYSFATGRSQATGILSTAIGNDNFASGNSSFAVNYDTTASGTYSFSANQSTVASGVASFAINALTEAVGIGSFSQGLYTNAYERYSSSFGYHTNAYGLAEVAIGTYNTTYTPSTSGGIISMNDRAFVVGNGTDFGPPSDAFEVWNDGRVIINDAYTLPTADGNANELLQTDGSGNISWANPSTTVIHSIDDLTDGRSPNPSSVFLGVNSGVMDDGTNNHNTGLGYNALSSNISGTYNLAIGSNALFSNLSGFQNIGIGSNSLYSNVDGIYNIAIGGQTLNSNNGDSNFAIGYAALASNTTGSTNIAIGTNSLSFNINGSNNIAIGASAIKDNVSGRNNTGIGTGSLSQNTVGHDNTALGWRSIYSNLSGRDNVGIGYSALYTNSDGDENIAVGKHTLYSNTSGTANVALGHESLYANTTGNYNIAIGNTALTNNTTANGNIAIGQFTLNSNTTATGNIAIGSSSLYSNNIGLGNISLGGSGLYNNTTGSHNMAFGGFSLYQNQSGSFNVALGSNAGRNNVTGDGNIFLGYHAGYNETGSDKLYIANSSVDSNNALIYGEFDTNFVRLNARTAITSTIDASGTPGSGALEIGNSLRLDGNEIITNNNTTLLLQTNNNGDLNVDGATLYVDASTNNVGVGTLSPDNKLSVQGTLNINENIGGPAVALRVNGSEALWYNGSYFSWGFDGTANYFADNVGLGTATPAYRLQLSTNSAAKPASSTWFVISDARLKNNVHEFKDGLELLNQINPVWFTYNGKAGMPNETGVGTIAQDLQEIAPYMVNEWTYTSEDGTTKENYLAVDYGAMDFVLINAIKEQQQIIEEQKAKIESLEQRIQRLEEFMTSNQ